jgi:hypothetical protein
MSIFKFFTKFFATPKYRVFISYSRQHMEVARDFYNLLKIEQREPFVDYMSIQLGEVWDEKLRAELEGCTHFYVLWCAHADKSKYVAQEIRTAIGEKKTIIPIVIGNYPLSEDLKPFQGIPKGFESICNGDFMRSDLHTVAHATADVLRAQHRSDVRQVRNRQAALVICFLMIFPIGAYTLLPGSDVLTSFRPISFPPIVLRPENAALRVRVLYRPERQQEAEKIAGVLLAAGFQTTWTTSDLNELTPAFAGETALRWTAQSQAQISDVAELLRSAIPVNATSIFVSPAPSTFNRDDNFQIVLF